MENLRPYVITTDTTSDLTSEYMEQNGVGKLCISYTMDGKQYDGDKTVMAPREFYTSMRAGAMPQTTQVNPQQAYGVFKGYLEQGLDIVHIGFSSALSGSLASAQMAAEDLRGEFPGREIFVVDSLCASLGEGLLVHKAVQLKKAGKSSQEVAGWLEENKLHLCHLFTVNDLFHLHRGGRVSKTAAVLGSMLGIKPVLHVDEEGRLVPISKVRGRKQALTALVDYMEKNQGPFVNDEVFISHGDCEEDARFVAELVKKRFHIDNIHIGFIGPSIGTHSGPGTVALFFLGEKR